MTGQFWWYVARASGMVAAVLLGLTVVWGLLLSTKLIERRGLPAWLTDLHRALGGLSALLIGVHLLALVADDAEDFGWAELFVPFASSWRAGPVAWGVGAFWGLVVVEGSSLLQRRMRRSGWRRLHLLSYPVAVMTALHAATAGSDAGNPVFRVVSIGLVLVVSVLTLFRVLHHPVKPSRSVVRGRGPRPDLASQNGRGNGAAAVEPGRGQSSEESVSAASSSVGASG